MIPQINESLSENVYQYRQPTLTYRLSEVSSSGKIDGIEAMVQAVRCILSTERYSNPIYSDNYGVELEQYIGSDFSYLSATIEGTIRDALFYDDRITNVKITKIEQSGIDSCLVAFMVYTIYGSYEEEINVLQWW